jgi:hypothetical protein
VPYLYDFCTDIYMSCEGEHCRTSSWPSRIWLTCPQGRLGAKVFISDITTKYPDPDGEERGERTLFGIIHNKGSGAAPAFGLRITTLRSDFPHAHLISSLHGQDIFSRTLMRGSPDGTVEPDRYSQQTLDLAA